MMLTLWLVQIHTQRIFNLARIAGACLNIQEGLEKILNKLINVIIDYKFCNYIHPKGHLKLPLLPPPPRPFQARIPRVNSGHFQHYTYLFPTL